MNGCPYRLAWLLLSPEAKAFLLSQKRRHAAHDKVAKPDRLAHHATLWFTGECGPFDEFARDFKNGTRLAARPLGVASDERVEALVVEIAGHRFQHGSRRLLHITLSLAAGFDAKQSVTLLEDPPPLSSVDWPDLLGEVEYVLPPVAAAL